MDTIPSLQQRQDATLLSISGQCIFIFQCHQPYLIIKHRSVAQNGESEELQISSYVYIFLKYQVTHRSVMKILQIQRTVHMQTVHTRLYLYNVNDVPDNFCNPPAELYVNV